MSFRLRLILLNSLVVLVTVLLAGKFLMWRTQEVFLSSLDRDMERRASRSPIFPRGDFGGPGNRPPGIDDNRGGPPGSGPAGRNRPQIANDDVQRPAVFNRDGEPFHQQEKRILDAATLKIRNLRDSVFSTKKFNNIETRIITVPIWDQGEFRGYVQMGHDLADFDRLKQTQNTVALLLIPFVMITAGLLGAFLAERALRPVKAVADTAERITSKDLSTRLDVNGHDELARLAGTFNSMLERLQGSFGERDKLIRDLESSLERQRSFVADASHELRTPLSRLRLITSSALTQDSTEAEVRRALEIADQAGISMTSLVEQLLALARLEGADHSKDSAHLADVVREATEPFAGRVETPNTDDVLVRGNHADLVRAVTNLLQNAHRHTPDDGQIVVEVRTNETHCTVSVIDSGSGIAAEHLPNLGRRFYRVDEARNRKDGGSGLGLSIVRNIVESVEGEFQVESQLGKGTRVTLKLPRA